MTRRLIVTLIVALVVAPFLPRATAEVVGHVLVGRLASDLHVEDAPDEKKVLAFAKWAAGQWDGDAAEPWIFGLAPYLYHRNLPAWIRMPVGSIEFIFREGPCNSAAQLLSFVLHAEGIEAVRHDIVDPHFMGHSALSVRAGDHWVFLDPFYGVAFSDGGRLLSFGEAQTRAREGGTGPVLALRESPATSFYDALPTLLHAKAGEVLDIHAVVRRADMPLRVGAIDGSAADVTWDAQPFGLSSHQHWLGSRYSRDWIRSYQVEGPALVAFDLMEEPDARYLPEANFPAVIDGKTVTYALDCSDCRLVLSGKNVPWDWRRFKSWYDVDRLTILPVGATSHRE